mgnify:CR=1 FL=1
MRHCSPDAITNTSPGASSTSASANANTITMRVRARRWFGGGGGGRGWFEQRCSGQCVGVHSSGVVCDARVHALARTLLYTFFGKVVDVLSGQGREQTVMAVTAVSTPWTSVVVGGGGGCMRRRVGGRNIGVRKRGF